MDISNYEYLISKAKTAVHQYAICRKKTSTAAHEYKNITHNVLTLNISTEMEYISNGKKYNTAPGTVIFMPAGSSFSCRAIKPGENISVRFDSRFDPEKSQTDIMVFTDFPRGETESAFRGVLKAYLSGDGASYFKAQAELNKIFYNLAKAANTYYPSNKTEIIKPAVSYINEHYLESDFNVKHAVKLTNISNTYFCRLFTTFYKMPPMQYVINKRIDYAKDIIANEPETSVNEIAVQVGYNDPFYFSRLFKKYTGLSPSAYIKSVKE